MGLIYLRRWDNEAGIVPGLTACQARDLGLDGHAPFAVLPLTRGIVTFPEGVRGLARLPRQAPRRTHQAPGSALQYHKRGITTCRGARRGHQMLKWNDIIRFADQGNPKPDVRVVKRDEEWRAQLTPEQYRITRQQGTERAFSSEMCSLFQPGLYACLCCSTLLFDAREKFESGTGWPSFTQPLKDNVIAYRGDESHGMRRIEATCNTCDAHLGHVFPDGPAPSGLRYCMNALALKKVKA